MDDTLSCRFAYLLTVHAHERLILYQFFANIKL